MMDTIAQRLLESVSWGLKMRLYTGAGLSIVDVVSDVNVIMIYLNSTENAHYAWILIAMICTSLLIQVITVVGNNLKNHKKMLKELLIVFSFLKPGIDALRVGNGAEREAHHAFNPKVELVMTKCAEIFGEAIPGSILQTYVYIKGQGNARSSQALASILVSAASTGFVSASIAFDMDVDPEKRRSTPDFFGVVPDGAAARSAIFGCMIMNSALLLLVRSIGAALLLLLGGR
jgi:hypothetical protein